MRMWDGNRQYKFKCIFKSFHKMEGIRRPETLLPDLYQKFNIHIHDGPKHQKYITYHERLQTFKTYSRYWNTVAVSPEDLAKCGFFSLGVLDAVSCFYCDDMLCKWNVSDSPWIEHYKYSPDCLFVKLNRNKVTEDEKLFTDDLKHFIISAFNNEYVKRFRMEYVYEPVYNIRKFLISRFKREGEMFKSYNDIQTEYALFTNDTLIKIDKKLEEISNSIENMGNMIRHLDANGKNCCEICGENELNCVFLPCAHLSTCTLCAPSFTACPHCRSKIAGCIKIYTP